MRKGKFYSLEDYIITDEGNIINKHNKHLLKPQPNQKGYLRVVIGKKRYFVHRLVAEAFIPNPNNLPQVNHKDGNKENNNVNNLEWVNNKQNREHAVKNKLHLCGEKCSYSKLNEEKVLFIRKYYNEFSIKTLAEMFNVSRSTVSDVINNRTWKQIQ